MIEYVLGEIADVKTGPFGTQLKASEYVSDGIPIINVKNIGFGNLIKDDMDYVDLSTCQRLEEHILKENDIVFGRKGSVDRHCIIRREEEGWLQGSDCIRVRIHNDEVNSQYVSCYLMQEGVKRQLNNAAVGSTMASMNSNIIKSITMKLPSIEEQNIIADFFEKIHQKIEINNRINQELERMAKSIYDYWFLQFEFPNEEGKPYKSSGGKMVWNEELKREIPEGWKVSSIFKCMDTSYGVPLATKLFSNNEGMPVVRIRDILENSISAYTKEIVEENYISRKKDLLIGMDGNFHMNFWNRDGDCINQRIFRIRDKESRVSVMQVYFEIEPYIRAKEVNLARSTVGHLSDKDLKQIRIVVANEQGIYTFFNSVLTQICENKSENEELKSFRDFLLPLLMNGQVRFDN